MKLDDRPRLAPGARLRLEPVRGEQLLLLPERGLRLQGSAVEVLRLCSGELTVAAMIGRLRVRFPSLSPREVVELLEALAAAGALRVTRTG